MIMGVSIIHKLLFFLLNLIHGMDYPDFLPMLPLAIENRKPKLQVIFGTMLMATAIKTTTTTVQNKI